jgi:hypothetical protein
MAADNWISLSSQGQQQQPAEPQNHVCNLSTPITSCPHVPWSSFSSFLLVHCHIFCPDNVWYHHHCCLLLLVVCSMSTKLQVRTINCHQLTLRMARQTVLHDTRSRDMSTRKIWISKFIGPLWEIPQTVNNNILSHVWTLKSCKTNKK